MGLIHSSTRSTSLIDSIINRYNTDPDAIEIGIAIGVADQCLKQLSSQSLEDKHQSLCAAYGLLIALIECKLRLSLGIETTDMYHIILLKKSRILGSRMLMQLKFRNGGFVACSHNIKVSGRVHVKDFHIELKALESSTCIQDNFYLVVDALHLAGSDLRVLLDEITLISAQIEAKNTN